MSHYDAPFEIHLHGDVPLRPDVTFEQLQDALKPLWTYAGARSLADAAESAYEEEPGIRFDAQAHLLTLCWTISGDEDFRQALDEMCMSLNELAGQGAAIEVTFYDTEFDEDEAPPEAESRDDFVMLFVGPTPAAIMQVQRDLLVEDVVHLMERHFEGAELDGVVAHEAGHVRHRHLWFYLLFFSGVLVFGMGIFFQLAGAALHILEGEFGGLLLRSLGEGVRGANQAEGGAGEELRKGAAGRMRHGRLRFGRELSRMGNEVRLFQRGCKRPFRGGTLCFLHHAANNEQRFPWAGQKNSCTPLRNPYFPACPNRTCLWSCVGWRGSGQEAGHSSVKNRQPERTGEPRQTGDAT